MPWAHMHAKKPTLFMLQPFAVNVVLVAALKLLLTVHWYRNGQKGFQAGKALLTEDGT